MYGSWGLDDEKCLDDCNFPPLIGKQGVKGCKAAFKCKIESYFNGFQRVSLKIIKRKVNTCA